MEDPGPTSHTAEMPVAPAPQPPPPPPVTDPSDAEVASVIASAAATLAVAATAAPDVPEQKSTVRGATEQAAGAPPPPPALELPQFASPESIPCAPVALCNVFDSGIWEWPGEIIRWATVVILVGWLVGSMFVPRERTIQDTSAGLARVEVGSTFDEHAAFCETAYTRAFATKTACGAFWTTPDGRALYCLFSAPSGRTGRTVLFDPTEVELSGKVRTLYESDDPCPSLRQKRSRHNTTRVSFAAQRPLVLRGDAAVCFQHLREVLHTGWRCETQEPRS